MLTYVDASRVQVGSQSETQTTGIMRDRYQWPIRSLSATVPARLHASGGHDAPMLVDDKSACS